MKKLLTFLLCFAVTVGIAGVVTMAAGGETPPEPVSVLSVDDLKLGDYFTLGKYNDAPIVWRYVADDEHGKLVVSDRILCFKPFFGDYNFWEESFPRKWLNSAAPEGEVLWGDFNDNIWTRANINPSEKGFLHESNFSVSERSVMKTVTQWTMLPMDRLELATNGQDEPYNALKEFKPGSPLDGGYFAFYDISELPDAYYGAAYEITDTVFLMDEMQVYRMWENLGDARAMCADSCMNRPTRYIDADSVYYDYFLRTPIVNEVGIARILLTGTSGTYSSGSSFFSEGIRPAFYLNTDTAVIASGRGTADDPYKMDGKTDGISVFCNGTELAFDVPPMIENDRTLVPFRAIFEALGTKVGWNGETQEVTGELNETTIRLTIGNETAYVNGQAVPLDVPPRIVNSRTLVPLRFIAENFGFKVEWDEVNRRVDITT